MGRRPVQVPEWLHKDLKEKSKNSGLSMWEVIAEEMDLKKKPSSIEELILQGEPDNVEPEDIEWQEIF